MVHRHVDGAGTARFGAIVAAIIGMVVATARMGGVDFAAARVRPRAMSTRHDIAAIATRLIAAYDSATQIAPITDEDPTFDVAAAYDVLREIENRRRIAQGWQTVGRKIGFTNTTIWSRYDVYQPMWAHIWTHSTHFAKDGHATLALKPFVQPRIEPEVVFRLRHAVPSTNDPLEILRCIEWIAPGFEIVQSPFPGLEILGCGLHGGLRPAWRARGRHADRRSPIATARRWPRRCRRSS